MDRIRVASATWAPCGPVELWTDLDLCFDSSHSIIAEGMECLLLELSEV